MIKIISFLIQLKKKKKKKKKTRNFLKVYRSSDATFYVPINTIYQFIKPFLDKNVYF